MTVLIDVDQPPLHAPTLTGPAFRPASACGRGCLPRPGITPRVTGATRMGRLLALVLVLLGGLGVAVAVPLLRPAGRARTLRSWFRALLRASGVRLTVHGGANGVAATLLVANHVSWLDIPAILAVEPVRVVAKSDVRNWPLIGLLAARGGTVFIDREHLRALPGTVTEVASVLRAGQSVLAFPEGSTWCGRTHGRLYPAIFQAAVDAGAPVRPVALRYRLTDGTVTTAAAFVGTDSLLASVWRVLSTRGLVVEVSLTEGLSSVPNHTRRTLATAAGSLIRTTTT